MNVTVKPVFVSGYTLCSSIEFIFYCQDNVTLHLIAIVGRPFKLKQRDVRRQRKRGRTNRKTNMFLTFR